jgi:hypothetical protein
MRYSSRGEGAGEGGIGGSSPQYAAMEAGGGAVAAPSKKGQLKYRPAAGRRGRKSVRTFLDTIFFSFYFFFFFSPIKSFFPKKGTRAAVTRNQQS